MLLAITPLKDEEFTTHLEYGRNSQSRSEGGAGRTGRHLPGAANGRKLFLKIHVKIQIVISYVFACNKNKALQLQRGILAFKKQIRCTNILLC